MNVFPPSGSIISEEVGDGCYFLSFVNAVKECIIIIQKKPGFQFCKIRTAVIEWQFRYAEVGMHDGASSSCYDNGWVDRTSRNNRNDGNDGDNRIHWYVSDRVPEKRVPERSSDGFVNYSGYS